MKKLNRKSLPKWTKQLSADEIRHLRDDMGSLTLRFVKENVAFQQKMVDEMKNGEPFRGCWTCRGICNKLQSAGVI